MAEMPDVVFPRGGAAGRRAAFAPDDFDPDAFLTSTIGYDGR